MDRTPGQGAQEIADELTRRAPVRTWISRLLGLRTEERSWRLGARGERTVGRRLAQLSPAGWTVRHDLTLVPPSNVDHLVLGPPGVFAIDTKRWTGQVWAGSRRLFANGHLTDAIEKARWCASTVAQALRDAGEPTWVEPVLAFVGTRVSGSGSCNGVTVLSDRELVPWLESLPSSCTENRLARLRWAIQALPLPA